MFLEDINECFSVRIRRAAVSRMNNDPADIGLRGKAFGSWAACSRPTDDWWPAEERKHVQLWGKWFTEAVDSCHSLENIKVMVGSVFQITEHSHDTEMFLSHGPKSLNTQKLQNTARKDKKIFIFLLSFHELESWRDEHRYVGHNLPRRKVELAGTVCVF